MKVRKKAHIVVDAHRWHKNGDHPDDYSQAKTEQLEFLSDHDGADYSPEFRRAQGWEGEVVRYFRHPNVPGDRVCEQCGHTMHAHGWIDSPKLWTPGFDEGGHVVCPGDWVVTYAGGDHGAYSPGDFADTYEELP